MLRPWRLTIGRMPTPTAQDMYTAYLTAELAILAGKEATLEIAGTRRTLKHEDLTMVQTGRREWERQANAAAAAATGAPSIGGLGYAVFKRGSDL